MNEKIAIITQSYKNDYRECRLLCESIDRFAPEIDHFVFVNDEDVTLFRPIDYGRHKVIRKGIILPWYLFRLPWKLMGHHFYISLFTIPVREWILQQICKLGVFEVIGDTYDAVFNIDSETVLMKPLDLNRWINSKGEYMMFRDMKEDEPSKDDYYSAAKKLLNIPDDELSEMSKWNYMNTPVCFERKNVKDLLDRIRKEYNFWGGWKRALCNTYRFSEYYTYGIYTDYYLQQRNHFLTEEHYFPQIEMSSCKTRDEFATRLEIYMDDDRSMGLWLQKADRKANSGNYLDFNIIENVVREYWKKHD